ncbi:MAG TPA: hypothetical protein VFR03_03035 [Thermoanaerobaculia bacterium]|nr:hypothetical protein [Thermoanaerobaculia bacterium]
MLNRLTVAVSLCLSALAVIPAFGQDQNVINPLRGNVVTISRTVAPNNVVTAVSFTLADSARTSAGQPPRRFTVTCDPVFQYWLCYDPANWLWGCSTQAATATEDFTGIRHDSVYCASGVGKCADVTGWLDIDAQGYLRINLDQIIGRPASYCTAK